MINFSKIWFKIQWKIQWLFQWFSKIKNKTEISNAKIAHLFDGIALTKFIFWLKNNYKKTKITEVSAQNKLEKYKKQNKNYLYPSFNTISGFGGNGAIVHYRSNNNTNKEIKGNNLYLLDSGSQYFYGFYDVYDVYDAYDVYFYSDACVHAV